MKESSKNATFPQMLTANRLEDGVVVYWDGRENWVEDFQQGSLCADRNEAEAALSRAEIDVKNRRIVGPYLIAVRRSDSGWEPANMRERIRASHAPTFTVNAGSWSGRISD